MIMNVTTFETARVRYTKEIKERQRSRREGSGGLSPLAGTYPAGIKGVHPAMPGVLWGAGGRPSLKGTLRHNTNNYIL